MQVVRLAEEHRIEVWATQEMLLELGATLQYERLTPRLQELGLSVADILTAVTALVSLVTLEQFERIVPDDADDDIFPNCARAVGAQYLVPGNKHLLRLKEWVGIPIVTPREFLECEFPKMLESGDPARE